MENHCALYIIKADMFQWPGRQKYYNLTFDDYNRISKLSLPFTDLDIRGNSLQINRNDNHLVPGAHLIFLKAVCTLYHLFELKLTINLCGWQIIMSENVYRTTFSYHCYLYCRFSLDIGTPSLYQLTLGLGSPSTGQLREKAFFTMLTSCSVRGVVLCSNSGGTVI